MTAPSCPVSFGQNPYYRSLFRGNQSQPLPTRVPIIPLATDLPSLIRTVNLMRDVLRQYTSSLVVNNLHAPKQGFAKAEGDTYNAEYPAWRLSDKEMEKGFIYHHEKGGNLDKNSRLWVQREHAVSYENVVHEEPQFVWQYYKALDAPGTEPLFPTANPLG